jgi:hypothetical protein
LEEVGISCFPWYSFKLLEKKFCSGTLRPTLDEGPGSNFLGTDLVSATLEIQIESLKFCSKLFTRLVCSAWSVCRYHTCSVNKATLDWHSQRWACWCHCPSLQPIF